MADLFGEEVRVFHEPLPSMSADRKRTLKNERLIAGGIHPTRQPLRAGNETCGTCAHLREKRLGKTYFKCAKAPNTGGPATDIRKRWPACVLWEKTPTPVPEENNG